MSRTETLIAEMKTKAGLAAEIEGAIAVVVPRIEENQRRLKSRTKRLWLNADGTGINPAMDVKPADAREGVLAKLKAEDLDCVRIVNALDSDVRALNGYRATLAGYKRDIQVIETELATYRAELNAEAARAFGSMATANGNAARVAAPTA